MCVFFPHHNFDSGRVVKHEALMDLDRCQDAAAVYIDIYTTTQNDLKFKFNSHRLICFGNPIGFLFDWLLPFLNVSLGGCVRSENAFMGNLLQNKIKELEEINVVLLSEDFFFVTVLCVCHPTIPGGKWISVFPIMFVLQQSSNILH